MSTQGLLTGTKGLCSPGVASPASLSKQVQLGRSVCIFLPRAQVPPAATGQLTECYGAQKPVFCPGGVVSGLQHFGSSVPAREQILSPMSSMYIPATEKAAYGAAFDSCDTDRDGFILATEAPALLGQSGLGKVRPCPVVRASGRNRQRVFTLYFRTCWARYGS